MKNKGINVITNFIIGIMGIIFVILVWLTWREFRYARSSYIWSEDSLLGYIQMQDYAGVLQGAYNNEMRGIKSTDTMKECYAAAYYYEAAVLYKAYAEMGKTEEAKKYGRIMEEQEALMGELTFAAEEIREELGLLEE